MSTDAYETEAKPQSRSDQVDSAMRDADMTVAEQLQDLVLDSADVTDFLGELSQYSAALASAEGTRSIECAVTLRRRRKSITGSGSSPRARALNDIQAELGAGPCLTALEEGRTVLIADTGQDGRWPDYEQALARQDIRSVLAVPLLLEQGAAASINFFSPAPNIFTDGIVHAAELYAAQARKALLLAVRIGSQQDLAQDLHKAMKSRTVIDLAVGVIMGQQRCEQQQAFEILARASSNRNKKLRDVAVELLSNLTSTAIDTKFDD